MYEKVHELVWIKYKVWKCLCSATLLAFSPSYFSQMLNSWNISVETLSTWTRIRRFLSIPARNYIRNHLNISTRHLQSVTFCAWYSTVSSASAPTPQRTVSTMNTNYGETWQPYLGLHKRCLFFCQVLTKSESEEKFCKDPNPEIPQEKKLSCAFALFQAIGQSLQKLTVALCNCFAEAPQKWNPKEQMHI